MNMINGIFFVLTLLCIGWFFWQYHKEKRSLVLGISFVTAVIAIGGFIVMQLLRYDDIDFVRNTIVAIAVIFIAFLFLFPFALIFSFLTTGIQLIRHEGLRLSHFLSLGFGIAYIVYLIGWPLLENTPKSNFFDFLYVFLSFVFYFTLLTLIFYTITSFLNLIKVPGKKYQHIIVLGSGLINGNEMSPLLASRVDKGIALYHENPNSRLVLSGGKGEDETMAEGEAMRDYALSQGVPKEAILVDNKSMNTKENLLFSQDVIKASDKEIGNLLVVTTRYHVLRALLLAKNLGIACDGRGSKTKLYFSINAFVREWIAYLVMWRKSYFKVLAVAFVISGLRYLIPWLITLI